MQSFVMAAATMAAMATATCSFVEGVGRNGTTGQVVCLSSKKSTNLLPNAATDAVKWTVDTWSVHYMDSGDQMFRIQHNLTANVFATDVVTFELAFRPKNLPNPTDTATIGEDYVQCEMTRSSTNTQFWTAAVSEGFYICKGTTDLTNVCLITDQTNAALYTAQTETTSDWSTPYTDKDPDDTWCTKANTKAGDTLSPFECTKLKCVIERKLDTGDAVKDLAFSPTAAAADNMVIRPGRAKLYFNKSTSQFAFPLTSETLGATAIEIEVPMGAASLFASASAALAFAALF